MTLQRPCSHKPVPAIGNAAFSPAEGGAGVVARNPSSPGSSPLAEKTTRKRKNIHYLKKTSMRKLFLILMAVLACSWSLSAQTKTITGTVVDAANNEPLFGATVMPIGGGQGTSCDIDGKFKLTVPASVTKVKVSYVGYTPQTVAIAPGMTVYLASASTDLEDVVVVAYGTANKESLTGSVAVVGAKEIEDRPVTSATAALEGNAPGVQVNNTLGTPGSEPSVRIRGFSSVTGNNDPLYVVDGVPWDTGINDLNPQDIESISVLKDAASCALYGNKGSNGVVLITTKRAKRVGKVDVNLSISQGMYNRGLPQYDKLGTDQWMTQTYRGVYNQMLTTSDMTPSAISEFLQKNIIASNYIPSNVYGGDPETVFDLEGNLTRSVLPVYDDLDWWDIVSRSGHRQEYTLNATGATESFNTFASVGYLKEKGYLLQTDFERYSGRINSNFIANKYLKVGVNLSGTIQKGNNDGNAGESNTGNPFHTDQYSPIYPYYKHDEETGELILNSEGGRVWNDASYLAGNNLGQYLRLNFQEFTYYNVNATAYATAVLPYGFEATVRGNINRSKTEYDIYTNNQTGNGVNMNGIFAQQASDNRFSTFMQNLNWSQNYGLNHVDALLGHENFQTRSSYLYGSKQDQSFPGIYTWTNFVDMSSMTGGAEEYKSESYYARGRYNYDQKYFAEVSFRRDGSSRFSKDNRWGNFWSIGASWIITKEKFMNELPWVSFLKLRTAYGTVGNDKSAGLYKYYTQYSLGDYFNRPIAVPYNYPSNNLSWETTKSFDIGLEGTLFDDRFRFDIGYFDKRSTDLIFNVRMPRSAGSNWTWANPTIPTNIGTMANHGWELHFGVDILRNQDFVWSFDVDGSFIDNSIKKLPNHLDIENGLQRLSEGHSLYEWYTYHYAGVDQMDGHALYELNPNAYEFTSVENGADNFETKLQAARENGELREINGRYYVTNTNNASRDWHGSAIPTVYGSFGTNFSWKGLTIGMLFTYSLGGKTYDSNYSSLMGVSQPNGLTAALHKDVLKAWTHAPEGMTEDSPNRIDPKGTPVFNYAQQVDNNGSSDRWLTSSNYLVFKNLNVSYSLPKKWVDALQMTSISLGMSVDNLFTATRRKGMNPQYNWSGEQSLNFVTARVFSFQINAKF